LAIEKRRNLGVFLTPLRTLQTRAAFIGPFTSQKMFIPHLAIENDFSKRICKSLYDVKPKAQSKQCAPYCAFGY
jgi:hypothetical protein